MHRSFNQTKRNTCWETKTRLQMALILVLITAVPFLFVMTAIYILFVTVWNRSELCEKLCSVMSNGYKAAKPYRKSEDQNWGKPDNGKPSVLIPGYNDIIPPWQLKNATQSQTKTAPSKERRHVTEHNFNRQLQFPSIAALLENLYNDEEEEQVVKCSVAIISPNWALTTLHCVKSHINKVNSISVRINSEYWSKDGVALKIEKLVPFKKLVALELKSSLRNFVLMKILENEIVNSTPGHSFLWKGRLDGPLKMRRKYDKLRAVDVNLYKLGNRNFGYSDIQDRCLENDSPLLDQNHSLIGFQLQIDCGQKFFSYTNIIDYLDWLKFLIS